MSLEEEITKQFNQNMDSNKNTLFSTYVKGKKMLKDITFDEVLEVAKNIPPGNPIEKVEMCKKHWKLIDTQLRKSPDKYALDFGDGTLYGAIRIVIRPYLKKARIYRKNDLSKMS